MQCMNSKYEQISQSYKELLDTFTNHKAEARELFSHFLQDFAQYLQCPRNFFILCKYDGSEVGDIGDAIYLSDGLPPWNFWFKIKISDQLSSLRFGIRIRARKEEEGWWNLQIAGEDRKFLVSPNPQEEDRFSEINQFIFDRSMEDIRSYFRRFLISNEGDQKPNIFGFSIS